jgi:hypothetical protein
LYGTAQPWAGQEGDVVASIFYQDKFKRQLPLTGLFIECVGDLMGESSVTESAEVVEVIKKALSLSELVAGEPTEEEIVYMIGRLNDMAEKSPLNDADSGPQNGKGKYFAGYLTDWAANLDYVTLCLYAAGYDYENARKYYETVDHQSLIAIAHEKLKFDFERARVALEASLFGFGGGYKDTPKEGDNVVDLTSGGEDANRHMESVVKGLF